MAKKTVAIVDDDEDLLRLLVPVFKSQGFEVKTFTTGKTAIAYLKDKQGAEIALLILDRVLPDMDGLEILKSFQKILTLILSILSSEKDVLQGLRKGAVDYMIKPFSIPILLQKAQKLLSHGS